MLGLFNVVDDEEEEEEVELVDVKERLRLAITLL